MTLKDYITSNLISGPKLAAHLGISRNYLYQIVKRERFPSYTLAYKIELFSKGAIKAVDLIKPFK